MYMCFYIYFMFIFFYYLFSELDFIKEKIFFDFFVLFLRFG